MTFADTSGLYSLIDDRDPGHERARTWHAEAAGHEDLVTHSYVVVEALSLVDRRLGPPASRTLADLLAPIAITYVDVSLHDAGMSSFLARERRRLSFVDLVSFEFMRRNGISRAFAFDRDFAAQGFEVIPH